MKKILFLLILIYSSSFAGYQYVGGGTNPLALVDFAKAGTAWTNGYSSSGTYYKTVSSISSCIGSSTSGCYAYYTQHKWKNIPTDTTLPADINYSDCPSYASGPGSAIMHNTGQCAYEFVPNPDPLGGGQCRDLFQKDGTAYTCNPNTNEATPIPNSNGTILDPESPNGNDKPNCNAGYEAVGTMTIAGGGNSSYNTWTCVASAPTGGDTGNTSGTGGTSEPTVTTNPDGSKTWVSPDGNTYNLTTNGTLTTTYADGSTSVKQVGGDYSAGSSGGSGTSGGGTGGTSGNTTNEDNTTPPTDTPIDDTPVANSCTDSTLTLQEKMLCELNAGMKKQNSEGAPENSLNQLLKDLKTSNQTDNTAINTNLKDVKALQENQLNKQTQANATLEKINNSANASELYNKVMVDNLNKISGQLEADPNTPSTGNALEGSGNIIDSLASTFTEFKDNMKNQGDTLGNLIDSANNTVNQGFTLTVNNSNLQTCPKSYILDLSTMGLANQTVIVDICYVASMLRPFLYPLFLILMTISLTFFTFKMIGVLL